MKPYLRAKTHHAPVRIDKPALSILAAIQPEVLLTYYAKDHLRDNGFLNRILPCFMGSNYKWVIPREPQVEDDKLRRQYHQKITAILKRCTGPGNPRPRFRLTLSPSAYGQINAYQTYVTSHPTFPDYLKGFVSKHPGNAIRIAACLHLWRHAGTGVAPEDAPINGSDMATAIELCKALLPHAAYAFDTQGRELSKDMQRVLNWIRRHQYRTFTVTDIQHGLSGIKQDKALLIASTLEGYKYLRLVVTPGRATICALNPYFR